MKNYSQFQEAVSTFMIFIMLVHLTGCVSSKKIVTAADIPVSEKYRYVVHGQKTNYLLENVSVSDGILSGKINVEKAIPREDRVTIYPLSDSVIILNGERVLSIPYSGIASAEITKMSAGKTGMLLLGCGILLLIIVGISNFRIDPFPNGI